MSALLKAQQITSALSINYVQKDILGQEFQFFCLLTSTKTTNEFDAIFSNLHGYTKEAMR